MKGPNAVALAWLDEAVSAARRARRVPEDEEALHLFRVRARRLVSYAKAVGAPCGARPRHRRHLRRLLRETGALRDAQVTVRWLEQYVRSRRGDAAAADLARALRGNGSKPPGRRWWRKTESTLVKLRRDLEGGAPPSALRATAADAARDAWARLSRRLDALAVGTAARPLHKTRIAVKRLRALVDALGVPPRGLPPRPRLRAWQRALGEIHDREIIAGRVAEAGRARRHRAAAEAARRQLAREKRELLAALSAAGRRSSGSRRRGL